MKALQCVKFGSPDELQLVELPDPVAGPGEVLVDVRSASINFPDVLMIAGQYQVKTEPPFIPGGELAGVIKACGEGVSRFKPGDRVIGLPMQNAFASQCRVRQEACHPLSDALDFDQGAALTVTYATALHAFRESTTLAEGETVLILGAAGGVGSAAIELARHAGCRVIAAASSQEKLDFARSLGATDCIDYSTENLRDTVRSLTDGKGVDVVFDPVGGELAQTALRSLAWHGRYLVVGFAAGTIPEFPANIALLKEARIIGVWWGTWAARHPREVVAGLQELADLVSQGVARPRIMESYPLESFSEAFAAVTGRRVQGKVVLRPSDG